MKPDEKPNPFPTADANLSAPQSMDAEVDDRGVVYLLDINRGLDILELNF